MHMLHCFKHRLCYTVVNSMDVNITSLASGVSPEAEALSTEISRHREGLAQMLVARSLAQQKVGTSKALNMALDDAKEAIRLSPRLSIGYLQAGFVLTDLQLFDSAEEMFKMASLKSTDVISGRLEEHIQFIRFLQRMRASEKNLCSENERLSVEQMMLENVVEQNHSILDLIAKELEVFEKQENNNFENNQKKLLKAELTEGGDSKKLIQNQRRLSWSEVATINNDKTTNRNATKSSFKSDETSKTKPNNIFGLNAVSIRGLRLPINELTIRKRLSLFGTVVAVRHFPINCFVDFSDPDSAVEAIAAFNNRVVDGLSANQQPLKLRFAPDKNQHHSYHSLNGVEYKQRVQAAGECHKWRLKNDCRKNCGFKHPPSDYDIDWQPNRGQLSLCFDWNPNDKSKPKNIFGLKAVFIRGLQLPIKDSTLQKTFSKFGTVVAVQCSNESTSAFVDFSNPDSAIEAIAAFNNKVINGLSADQKPVKMRFAPDKEQFHSYHSLTGDDYKQPVLESGGCFRWRLNKNCPKNCPLEHRPSDFDIDYQPNRSNLLKKSQEVPKQFPSVFDLIPKEEKQKLFKNEENKHVEDKQKSVAKEMLENDLKKQIVKSDVCCKVPVAATNIDKKSIETASKSSLKSKASVKKKPKNIFELKSVLIRGLQAPINESYIQKIFSRFGTVVAVRHCESQQPSRFVDFSDYKSATDAIAAFNNQVIEGLSANKQPIKMRFAPDPKQFYRYHSMSHDEYKRRVRSAGDCHKWRLKNNCLNDCGVKHRPADYDIDCQPDIGRVKKSKKLAKA